MRMPLSPAAATDVADIAGHSFIVSCSRTENVFDRLQPPATRSGWLSWFVSIFSERELTFTFAICCRPSVCQTTSVTLVHPTQAVQLFGNISTAFGTLAIH